MPHLFFPQQTHCKFCHDNAGSGIHADIPVRAHQGTFTLIFGLYNKMERHLIRPKSPILFLTEVSGTWNLCQFITFVLLCWHPTGLSPGNAEGLVVGLLSKFQSSEFHFEIFWRHLRARKQCFRLVSDQEDDELENAGFIQEVMQVWSFRHCAGLQIWSPVQSCTRRSSSSMQLVHYRKYVDSASQMQVSLTSNKDIIVPESECVAVYYTKFQIILWVPSGFL